MNYGEFKRNVYMEIGEYSANGSKISDLSNKDYAFAMIDATNQANRKYSLIGEVKKSQFVISQYNPGNLLTDEFVTFVHDDEDVERIVTGAQSYSFSAFGTIQVEIDENISGVWTNLVTISETQANYTLYTGNLTLTSTDNKVRIVFKGDYYYPVRNLALFGVKNDRIIEYGYKVAYDLPADFYSLERVVKLVDGDYVAFSNYSFNESTNEILLNYKEKGEFKVLYHAYPTELTFDEDNTEASDGVELDIPIEYLNAAILEVAGKMKANVDKKYGVGDRYQAQAIDEFNAVQDVVQRDNEVTNIIDPTEEW